MSSMMDIVPPPCPIWVDSKMSKQFLRTRLAFFSRSRISFSSCAIFFPPFRLNIDRFQVELAAAARAGVAVETQHRLLGGDRPHVEAAADLLPEIEEHVALLEIGRASCRGRVEISV